MKKNILKTFLFASTLGLSLAVCAAAGTITTNNPTGSAATNPQTPTNSTTTSVAPGRSGANQIGNTGDTLDMSRSSMRTTNPPLSTAPPATLPMAQPQSVDPANRANPTLNEAQRRARIQQPYQNAEVCRDDDAACLRRRSEQLRRNTPFENRIPPTPGSSITNPDGSLRQ